MSDLITTIGLEIHVQLATKSKMFCRCDNNAEGKEPNSVVCPICLGMPGSLPVANEQAILWTIKTGMALNCEIPKIAKFDRKHYFYPDLPKGYQISQYDEPFCVGGFIEIDGAKVRLNRIHLEEDAGKLMHVGGKSLVDLNRAGTPLMEMVTEPDITSPKQAGDFLRKLQKIVRDVVQVSEASMEKGHMRCDANISVTDGKIMSPIIELKNINSFRFVEKALSHVEEKLKDEYGSWPEKSSKETWGYDSKADRIYLQRKKEAAADYRYFPEPDLPPFDTSKFNLESLREINKTEEEKIEELTKIGLALNYAKVLANDEVKFKFFESLNSEGTRANDIAGLIVNNNFGFNIISDIEGAQIDNFKLAIDELFQSKITKPLFAEVTSLIFSKKMGYQKAKEELGGGLIEDTDLLAKTIDTILVNNPKEVESYKAGKTQLLGFFIGQIMREMKGKANPKTINELLIKKLNN